MKNIVMVMFFVSLLVSYTSLMGTYIVFAFGAPLSALILAISIYMEPLLTSFADINTVKELSALIMPALYSFSFSLQLCLLMHLYEKRKLEKQPIDETPEAR